MFTGDVKERLLDVGDSQSIIEMKIYKININKASGIDGIQPLLLRKLSKHGI